MGPLISWSGGKDAAFALEHLREEGRDPARLVVTIGDGTGRVSMHGVRPALVAAQADALGMPIDLITVPGGGTHEGYERVMREALDAREASEIAFADIMLDDVRAYREELLEPLEIAGTWPIWGRDTGTLARDVLDRGIRAIVIAVDGSVLSPDVLGCELSESFLDRLPSGVDACGENGEFHTFVIEGPSFDRQIAVRPGRRLTRWRNGTPYHYLDLVAAADRSPR